MSNASRPVFFALLLIVALVLLLAVYQVPQPWRGYLVGWLLFASSIGLFVLRVISHHYHYRGLQLTARQQTPPPTRHPATTRRATAPRPDAMRVVYAENAGKGRHTIR